MKIIEKIKIHRFRSISDVEIETDELVIFSGINNSGKSNVLKALNLFFKGESNFGKKYDFENDYNKAFTGQARGKRQIKITLHFGSQGDAALKYPFSISRTFEIGKQESQLEYHSTNYDIQEKLNKKDGNTQRQFTTFFNKIEYFYIPAVRDKNFVQSLFLQFEKLIEHDSEKEFSEKIHGLSKVLENKSKNISDDFKKFIGLPTQANLSSKITDILGAVEVNVQSGIKVLRRKKTGKKLEDVFVNLFSSGDGILMAYLAYFLAHICKKIQNRKFIWGFEEPENSLEYSKTQKLAEEFYNNFINNAQIFITTHSPAFIKLKDKDKTKFYRVYIRPNDEKQLSEIKTLDAIQQKQLSLFEKGAIDSEEYKKLKEELYFVEFAKEIEDAVERICAEEKILNESRVKFEQKYKSLLQTHPSRIFVCEDSLKEAIKFWERMLKMFKISDVKVMSSNGCTTKNVETWAQEQQKLDSSYKPKIFREIDRDGLTNDQIKLLKGLFDATVKGLTYKMKILPVNEIENFAVLSNVAKFDNKFWKKHEKNIIDDFQRCAESVRKRMAKTFNHDTEKESIKYFRQDDGGYMSIIQTMRDKAKNNKNKFFPGKEICAKRRNFKPIDYLLELDEKKLPKEFVKYMQDIKKFYEI